MLLPIPSHSLPPSLPPSPRFCIICAYIVSFLGLKMKKSPAQKIRLIICITTVLGLEICPSLGKRMEATTAVAVPDAAVLDTSITGLLQLGAAAATLNLPDDGTDDSPKCKKKRFCVDVDNSEQMFLEDEIQETVVKLNKQTKRLSKLLGSKNNSLQEEITETDIKLKQFKNRCSRLQKDQEKFKNLCSRLQRDKQSLQKQVDETNIKLQEINLELQTIKTDPDLNNLKNLCSRLQNEKNTQSSLCSHLHSENVSLQNQLKETVLELNTSRCLCDHLQSRQLSSLPEFLKKTAIKTAYQDELLSFVRKIPSERFVIKDGKDGYYGTERSCDLRVDEAKHVWKQLKLQDLFRKLCWTEYHDHARVDCRFTRFSVNLIKNGSRWHHDMVLPNQNGATLTTFPGLTLVVHLGSDLNDIVYAEYSHNLTKRVVCRPRAAYVFPGFCIRQRTIREYNLTGDPRKATPRYSLVAYITFKKKEMKRLNKKIREHFMYYTDDSYMYRALNFKKRL